MNNETNNENMKKIGRPRKYNLDDDSENRRYKANVQYLNSRYENDEKFKEYRKIQNAINYQKRKDNLKLMKDT